MKITILNGEMQSERTAFTEYIDSLTSELKKNNEVNHFKLNEMKLHYCTGCWSCWWKTPGRCALQDDAEQIFKAFIDSDFVIFASPLFAGFTTSLLKKITDRLIVLLHPYIELREEECHHRKRYDKYPQFGVLSQKEQDTDNEDIKIISDIYDRFGINFHNRKKYLKFIDELKPEELAYETCNN